MMRREYLGCLLLFLFLTTSSCQQVSSKPQVTQTSSQRFEPKPVVAFESKVSRSKRSDWTVRELPFATFEDVDLVEFASPDVGWAATGNGRIYKTVDGGAHWERVEVKLPSDASIVSISFVKVN